jgi:pimeloyl-ACP methyl ester carboxylesterase
LEKSGEKPPYILAGHSYGGHYIRIFKELYPNEVAAMVFLDSPHPDIDKRLKMPQAPSYVNILYKTLAVMGDLGLLNRYTRMAKRHILWAPGLPNNIMENYRDYTLSGKYIRGYLEEEKGYEKLVEISRKASKFDTIPVRVFSGTNLNEPMLRKMGIDPEFIRTERAKMQNEMASVSKNGKTLFLDGGHITIFSLKENAEIICTEILELIRELKS